MKRELTFSYKSLGLQSTLLDIAVRFIINCPPEDLATSERYMFQVEEAHWFYLDFACPDDLDLPHLSIYNFLSALHNHVPYLESICENWQQALVDFRKYKHSIPVRGAIILNHACDRVLLVQDYKSRGWSFPKGKINKAEEDFDCACREVEEETGFNIAPYVQSKNDFVQVNIRNKNYKLYVAIGVPENTSFKTQTRFEISNIRWFPISKLTERRRRSDDGTFLVIEFSRPLALLLQRKRGRAARAETSRNDSNAIKAMLGIQTADPAEVPTASPPVPPLGQSAALMVPFGVPPIGIYGMPILTPQQQQQLMQQQVLQQQQLQSQQDLQWASQDLLQQIKPPKQQQQSLEDASRELLHQLKGNQPDQVRMEIPLHQLSDRDVLLNLIKEGTPLEEQAVKAPTQGPIQMLDILKKEINEQSRGTAPSVPSTSMLAGLDTSSSSPALPPNSMLENLVTSRRAKPRKVRSSMPTRKPVLAQTALLRVMTSTSSPKQKNKLMDLLKPLDGEPEEPPHKPRKPNTLMGLLSDPSQITSENFKEAVEEEATKPDTTPKSALMSLLLGSSEEVMEDIKNTNDIKKDIKKEATREVEEERKEESIDRQSVNKKAGDDLMNLLHGNEETKRASDDLMSILQGNEETKRASNDLMNLLRNKSDKPLSESNLKRETSNDLIMSLLRGTSDPHQPQSKEVDPSIRAPKQSLMSLLTSEATNSDEKPRKHSEKSESDKTPKTPKVTSKKTLKAESSRLETSKNVKAVTPKAATPKAAPKATPKNTSRSETGPKQSLSKPKQSKLAEQPVAVPTDVQARTPHRINLLSELKRTTTPEPADSSRITPTSSLMSLLSESSPSALEAVDGNLDSEKAELSNSMDPSSSSSDCSFEHDKPVEGERRPSLLSLLGQPKKSESGFEALKSLLQSQPSNDSKTPGKKNSLLELLV